MKVDVADGQEALSAGVVSADDTLKIKVTVMNTSDKAGKEVVQIYSADVASSHITPVKKLVAYRKVEILPGEEKTVELSVPVSRLGFYDKDMNLCVEPGDFSIMAGSSSDVIHFTETVTLEGQKLFIQSETDDAGQRNGVNADKLVNVTVVVRDIQASVMEAVALKADGKTLALTDAEGRCSIRVRAGTKLILDKTGYKPQEITLSQEERVDVTLIPEI